MALIVLFPLFGIIVLAIKLESKGPALFLQYRVGKNHKPFRIYKFRTMHVNSGRITRDDGTIITLENDPRVTRVGRFLRVGFDELPQLINIIKGEMSLVGPRPDLPDQVDNFNDIQKQKYLVRPGITNLPAITGRNTLTLEQRIEIDIKYINSQSFWVDFKIIVITVLLLLGLYTSK